MNKKYLLGLCAASMLLATSCQNDENAWQGSDGLATVEMTVALPEITDVTRAAAQQFGNGYSADFLNYAVYEFVKKGNGIDTVYLPNQTVRNYNMNNQLSTNIALKLVPGSSYGIVFWAQHFEDTNDKSPYTLQFDKSGNIAEVTVDYAKMWANQEDNDAFFSTYKIENVQLDGGATIVLPDPVVLKRPFAQLNIGSCDHKAAADAGFNVKKAAVVISGGKDVANSEPFTVADALNLWTGDAYSSIKQSADREYKKNDIPDSTKWLFPIEDYNYLAMNYILVDADKSVLDKITIKLYDENDREKTRDFNLVPVQRNWRTNIFGELLTSDVSVNVKIDPLFADQNNVDDDNNPSTADKDEVYNEDRNNEKP